MKKVIIQYYHFIVLLCYILYCIFSNLILFKDEFNEEIIDYIVMICLALLNIFILIKNHRKIKYKMFFMILIFAILIMCRIFPFFLVAIVNKKISGCIFFIVHFATVAISECIQSSKKSNDMKTLCGLALLFLIMCEYYFLCAIIFALRAIILH